MDLGPPTTRRMIGPLAREIPSARLLTCQQALQRGLLRFLRLILLRIVVAVAGEASDMTA